MVSPRLMTGNSSGKTTGFVDPNFDLLGQRAKVAVAGGKFTKGIANTNHGPAVKLVVRHAFALGPAAVHKTVFAIAAKPLLAAQLVGFFLGCHGASLSLKIETRVSPNLYKVLSSYHCAI